MPLHNTGDYRMHQIKAHAQRERERDVAICIVCDLEACRTKHYPYIFSFIYQ